jgi:hypothetical protein
LVGSCPILEKLLFLVCQLARLGKIQFPAESSAKNAQVFFLIYDNKCVLNKKKYYKNIKKIKDKIN